MKNRIRVLRAEKEWTQAQLAAEVGVSRQAIIAVENGKYDPALPLAFRIARAFGKTVEEVFVWEDGASPNGKHGPL
jgi:putative transcriptional regulator